MAEDVTITIGGATPIVVPWQAGMNVQTALEAAYNLTKDDKSFSFACQFYGTYQGAPTAH